MTYLTFLRETHSNPKGNPYEILHTVERNVFEKLKKLKKLKKQRPTKQPLQDGEAWGGPGGVVS